MNTDDFLFSIVDTADGSAVFITSRYPFENDGMMSENFNKDELEVLEPVLEKAGLNELMESCYEMSKSSEETMEILLEQGLAKDKNFDNLIETLYS